MVNVTLSLRAVPFRANAFEKAKTGSLSMMARKALSFTFCRVPVLAKRCLRTADVPDSYRTSYILDISLRYSSSHGLSDNTYRRSCKVQGAPFCAIADLRKEQLRFSSDLPFSEAAFVALQNDIVELPDDLAATIPTHPLAVQINVDINIKNTIDVDGHIRRRNRLTECRCWSDRRQK